MPCSWRWTRSVVMAHICLSIGARVSSCCCLRDSARAHTTRAIGPSSQRHVPRQCNADDACCCPDCYRRPLLFKSNLWKWFDQFHHNDIFGRSVQSQKTWNIALTFSRRHRHRRVTVMVMHWTSIQVQSVGLLLYFEPCPVLPCPIILRTLFLPVQRKAIKHRYRTIRCPPPPPTLRRNGTRKL